MTHTLSAFYLGILLALAAVETVTPSAVEITFSTLKSDVELILKDPTNPRTVNIQYTKNAVLHMSILPKPEAKTGKYVKIDGILTIKLKDGSVQERNGLEYANDSFGLPTNQEETSFILIKENPHVQIKKAEKTIRYIPIQQLSNDLNAAKKSHEWHNVHKTFFCPDFPLGELTTTLTYDMEEEYLMLSTPLKGITLRGAEQLIETLFDINWYKEGSLACKRRSSGLPDGLIRGNTITPEVFLDVWYALGSKRYGSSTGSLGCVDAVRIYDEWSYMHHGGKAPLVNTPGTENRGNNIRERVFKQDMNTAYQLLHSGDQPYKNVIINYADEIIMEVRGGMNGGNQYVRATGTVKDSSEAGRNSRKIKAFYDLHNLEYNDRVQTNEEFAPENYGDESYYLKYIDWGTFENHLKGVWTVMQQRCTQSRKLSYTFSVFYGDSIRLKCDCQARDIVLLTDKIHLLTDVPGFRRTVISKCSDLRYTDKQHIELGCLDSSVKVLAIQQQPEKLLTNKFDAAPIIHAEVFKRVMKTLMGTLINNGKSTDKPTEGTITLDGDMLFEMKLPEKEIRPSSVEIHGNFIQGQSETNVYKKISFDGDSFATTSGGIVTGTYNDIFIDTKYVPTKYDSEGEYVIASKYVTTKSLQQYLEKVSAEALKRCLFVKTTFSFKLVQHRTFELRGFYDCFERVFYIQGRFRALILTKRDGNNEVRSDRVIDDFIYIENDKFFIPGSDSFEDVYAISISKMTDSWEETRESFGAPIQIDEYSVLLLKSN